MTQLAYPPLDPRRLPVHLQPSLPVGEQDYYAFWRAPRYRWWKGLLAIALAGFAFLVASTILSFVGWAIDDVDWTVVATGALPPVGPGFFIANNIALALCIPFAGLSAWLCVQQRPGWLSSVEGGVRWGWLLLLLAVLLPLWAVVIGGLTLLGPLDDVRIRDHTLVMIVGILLTTPLQAAGEEYLIRGLLGRAVGSWFSSPVFGVVAGTIVTAAVFMAMHGADDPWLNAFYVVFAVVGSWVTWRTGGLEAAVALHVANNLTATAILPFIDFSDLFNREAGAGDASVLVNVGLLLAGAGVVELLMRRRRNLVIRSAPGRPQLDALAAPPPGFGGPLGGALPPW
ncbi:CPBP family intramembrane metalloprotease [Propioniciclava sinopodophylli]|uniref:CPBP family intramembrane metalloprotease n=1 Tax=Propioniciclava sinopodophylli TaxID=1837344 RepID=A0A4Q9KCR5_9ACTN|nr:CPBP family intramembrane glutamic endopeptidase [Propioniciclava sinopodophylli]TBT84240.1 CPBP family intramembrane metalloprotease [Propioniciclava sinopodophylli]